MAINSIPFLFIFLPTFLLVYYLESAGGRNLVALLGSLVFYTLGVLDHPWCLALLLGFTLLSWLAGLWIERLGRPLLAVSLLVLFGSLLGFKYAGLFGQEVILPLGMSFFTFQIAAYLMDVYLEYTVAETSLLRYSTGILLFPKLLSGPLMEPEDLRLQLRKRSYSLCSLDDGIREFIVGLAMKTLLADRMGGLWTQATTIGFGSLSSPMAWSALLAYSLRLYFDFCGYSRMAVGLGMMLGFQLPENFCYPYIASSMGDFWRRWHITLSRWFRNYIYIPLGGSRNGVARWLISSLAVWLATGIWHGNSFNFILWGLFQFLMIFLEKAWLGKHLERHRILAHGYMILAILFSWLLFAVTDVGQIGVYLSRMAPFVGDRSQGLRDFVTYVPKYLPYLLAGVLFATPLPAGVWKKVRNRGLGTVICFVLFWLSVYCLSVSVNDPFMYFSF